MDEMSDKTFWIDQKDKGCRALSNGIFIKAGLIGTWKTTISEQGRELG